MNQMELGLTLDFSNTRERDYGRQGTLIFCASADTLGLKTMPAPNHVYLLMRHGNCVMYYNPTFNFCLNKYRAPSLKFEKWKLATLKSESPEEELELLSTHRHTIFPDSTLYNKFDQTLVNEKKIAISHFEKSDSDLFYYWLVKQYVKVLKPIAAYDVGVFQELQYREDKYGLPMYCHNMLISLLGLDLDTILTTAELKIKLRELSGKTNFDTFNLYERELTSKEKLLGSIS